MGGASTGRELTRNDSPARATFPINSGRRRRAQAEKVPSCPSRARWWREPAGAERERDDGAAGGLARRARTLRVPPPDAPDNAGAAVPSAASEARFTAGWPELLSDAPSPPPEPTAAPQS